VTLLLSAIPALSESPEIHRLMGWLEWLAMGCQPFALWLLLAIRRGALPREWLLPGRGTWARRLAWLLLLASAGFLLWRACRPMFDLPAAFGLIVWIVLEGVLLGGVATVFAVVHKAGPMVNGLPMPELLVGLIRQGRWVHPGDAQLRELIPFLLDPVDFLTSPKVMAWESSGHLADNPEDSAVFHTVRGSRVAEPVELPWLDADLSFFVAVNRQPGDDVAIALDYRTSMADPRVVASDWGTGQTHVWREVAPTFSGFVRLLGLGCQDAERDVVHETTPGEPMRDV
jgi:hypothetical protein